MANGNNIDYTVRVNGDGLEKLNKTLDATEAATKDLGTAATTAGAGVDKLGTAADKAADEVTDLSKAVDEKTRAIKAGLQVEQSEIELQRQHLAASQSEQQARLQAAQAKGDETAATRAQNALAQIEADQLNLVARLKRAEATAIQQATAARREELAAIGPLTAAQAKELQAAENHAKALRVEAAAADQAAQRAAALGTAHRTSAGATDQLSARVGNLTGLLGQMAGALGAAFTFRELVTAAAQMEQLRSGLTAVTGDATKAGKELEFVRTVAARIGADVTEVGRAFLGLSAATKGTAVEGELTRQVFEAVATAMGKAGKSSAETANALQALAQMASKGTVQSEELRGQLGEALPGALNAAAKGMGITTQELMKLVEEGKIAASDIFPALTKGLNELYGAAPAAQTLSQELTNIKNAATDLAANIGDAGGLTALKKGAEIAQGAIVGLDVSLVATGKSIGVVLAAIANWDFSGLKQAFADIEKEANDKILKAAQHNETLRNSLKNSGDQAAIAALAQQELANKTGVASAAALAGASDFVKLQNGYRIVRESIVEQITAQDKSVIARDAEGKAAVALAAAFGTETEQRQAQAAAAAASAAELERLAALKLQELATMQAELKALQEEVAQRGLADEAKTKQMAELEKAIALRQQETDKAVAQAGASRMLAVQTSAEAEAVRDNSGRVDELREAYEKARAKLEEVRAAKEAGLATTRELKNAENEAGRAATLYRDALADLVKALEAKNKAQQADTALATSALQLQLAQEKSYEATAKAMGNEVAVIASKIRQKEIEIKIIEATVKAQIAEADGSIAVAKAKMAELAVRDQLDAVTKLELETVIKLGQAKINQAKAVGESTKALEAEITSLRLGTNARDRHNDAVRSGAGAYDRSTAAMSRENDERERAIAAQERANDLKEREIALYEKKWNMDSQHRSLDADGKVREETGMLSKKGVYDRAKNAGLSEEDAVALADSFDLNRLKDKGSQGTPFINMQRLDDVINEAVLEAARRKAGGKDTRNNKGRGAAERTDREPDASGGTSRTSGGLGSSGVQTLDDNRGQSRLPSDGRGMGSSSGSGSGGGVSYVTHITIPGIGSGTTRHVDRESAQTEERLLRKLAQAKSVHTPI